MGILKTIFGNVGSRVWAIVSAVLIVVFVVVTVLSTAVFYDVFCDVLGGNRRIADESGNVEALYVSDHDSKEDAYVAANALNERVAEEGIVLLKNEGALPLASDAKVNVFGKNSVNLVYGGSGSGAGSTEDRRTLYESLDAADIEYNAELKAFYEDASRSGDPRPSNPPIENTGVHLTTAETPVSRYGDVMASCESADINTALVVFSRIGGEGFDLPRKMTDASGNAADGANADDHYLRLDNNERDLLDMVCGLDNIEHVIVIVNSSAPMELGFLDDPGHYAYDEKIDGALWIGGPGNSGIMALGRVLSGSVSPSGRLVDTYARDFTLDPTYVNFGDNMLSERVGRYVLSGNQYLRSESSGHPYYFVDYEEGIYVGYRYYETRGYTEGDGAYTGEISGTVTEEWEDWYSAHVVYPLGYGLSYTRFDWSVDNAEALSGGKLTTEPFSIEVTVTNTGSYAGKDVVQIYATPEYVEHGIEKSHKVLVGFAKTDTLYPASEAGEGKPNSQTLEISVDPYDLASYDYNDANHNDFRGWELDAGEYVFSVSRDAHTSLQDITLTLDAGVRYDKDPVTENEVKNRFDDADDQLSDVTVDGETRKGLSRSDWEGTWPTDRADRGARIVSDDFIAELADTSHNDPNASSYVMPSQPDSAPQEAEIRLRELNGEPYGSEKWERFMDQIPAADMLRLISNGNFKSPALLYVGKPETLESDGPVGFVNFMDESGRYYGTCSYASECVMGATWNAKLMREVGRSLGNEGIWGNAKGDGAPYSGLYAPGANIHRSPFSGRNFEYFSEDGFLSGMMAANEIAGAKEMGVYLYIKHFAVNDQETDRDSNGLVTWVTEQSMREIYFKPFEKAVKTGGATGVMSSFNRIGTTWAGGDHRLLTEVLRDEWGFRGTVISDFNLSGYMDPEQMAYAGGDLNLTNTDTCRWTDADLTDAADVYVIRRCAMNVLYTVANSCAMNDEVIGYLLPVWVVVLIVVDCVVAVGIAVWGFFALRKAFRASAKKDAPDPEGTSAA